MSPTKLRPKSLQWTPDEARRLYPFAKLPETTIYVEEREDDPENITVVFEVRIKFGDSDYDPIVMAHRRPKHPELTIAPEVLKVSPNEQENLAIGNEL